MHLCYYAVRDFSGCDAKNIMKPEREREREKEYGNVCDKTRRKDRQGQMSYKQLQYTHTEFLFKYIPATIIFITT